MRVLCKTIVAMVLIAAVMFTAYLTEKVRGDFEVLEYLYLPKMKELRKFAFGFEGEYADFLWIGSLQAFHKRMFQKLPFEMIPDLYDAITDLDPYFQEAYNTGSIYITICTKSSLKGIGLLEKGSRKVPQEPWMWELLGRMYWLERFGLEKNGEMSKEEATRRAVEAIGMGVKVGGDNQLKLLLEHLGFHDKFSTFDTLTWLSIFKEAENNEALRYIAARRLQNHIADLHLTWIREHLDAFHEKHRRWPENLEELKTALPKETQEEEMNEIASDLLEIVKKSESLSNDPVEKMKEMQARINVYIMQRTSSRGQEYRYDKETGEISSYFLEETKLSFALKQIHLMIGRFYHGHQRFPDYLNELVEKGVMKSLPKLPPWKRYEYSREEGIVSAVDK